MTFSPPSCINPWAAIMPATPHPKRNVKALLSYQAPQCLKHSRNQLINDEMPFHYPGAPAHPMIHHQHNQMPLPVRDSTKARKRVSMLQLFLLLYFALCRFNPLFVKQLLLICYRQCIPGRDWFWLSLYFETLTKQWTDIPDCMSLNGYIQKG